MFEHSLYDPCNKTLFILERNSVGFVVDPLSKRYRKIGSFVVENAIT